MNGRCVGVNALCEPGVKERRGVAFEYGFAGSFMKLSGVCCFTSGYFGSFSYVGLLMGILAGSMRREFRASRGVRLSRSRLSFSEFWVRGT